ncbi:MAG: hypothetical protein EOO38_29520, partial [Cytophagaceae bacterium]
MQVTSIINHIVCGLFVAVFTGACSAQQDEAVPATALRAVQTVAVAKNVKVVPVGGTGWAKSSVNAAVFRANSLVTHGDTQYIAYYDGETLYNGNHGLGYILGDEGSGTYFGKKMVISYLHKTMPSDLRENFAKEFQITKDIVVENVYQKPFPNSYLATFSRFM